MDLKLPCVESVTRITLLSLRDLASTLELSEACKRSVLQSPVSEAVLHWDGGWLRVR